MKFKRLSSGAGVFVCRYNEFEVVQAVPQGLLRDVIYYFKIPSRNISGSRDVFLDPEIP